MSVLNNLRNDVAAASAKAHAASSTTGSTERKASDFWLNIGVEIDTVDADGKPAKTFVSLPAGIALDDMKAVTIKGTNQAWIDLAQTKNTLLETLQKHAAAMEPGQRDQIPALQVEIYRRNEPTQVAATGDNPLIASLMSTLGQKKAA